MIARSRRQKARWDDVWVSKEKWKKMQERIDECEREIRKERERTDEKVYQLAKKILKQPEELLKEVDDIERTRAFVYDFINS